MLSVVILSFNVAPHLEKMLRECHASFAPQADETIIIEDSGKQIDLNPDVYLLQKENKGFTHSVNLGLKIASHQHVAIVSQDTYLVSGNIKALCIPDSSSSPLVENQAGIRGFAGSFFCLDKAVVEKVGYFNESMKTYWSDTEYIDRLSAHQVPMVTVDSVVIHHHIAQSVSQPHIASDDEMTYRQLKTRVEPN